MPTARSRPQGAGGGGIFTCPGWCSGSSGPSTGATSPTRSGSIDAVRWCPRGRRPASGSINPRNGPAVAEHADRPNSPTSMTASGATAVAMAEGGHEERAALSRLHHRKPSPACRPSFSQITYICGRPDDARCCPAACRPSPPRHLRDGDGRRDQAGLGLSRATSTRRSPRPVPIAVAAPMPPAPTMTTRMGVSPGIAPAGRLGNAGSSAIANVSSGDKGMRNAPRKAHLVRDCRDPREANTWRNPGTAGRLWHQLRAGHHR
jgi:hypothetical protein